MLSREPGKVSVSKTGPPDAYDWHTFDNGPYADDFPPTLGRVLNRPLQTRRWVRGTCGGGNRPTLVFRSSPR